MYSCSLCNSVLNNWNLFDFHFKKVHKLTNNVSDFVCPQCNQIFKKLSSYRKHLSKVH